jgi:hypothetical protein
MAYRFAAEKGLNLGIQKKWRGVLMKVLPLQRKQVIKILMDRLGGVRIIDFIWRL